MSTFSRILLNPQRRQARKLLINPQAMHAAVRSAFPPDIDESDARVLWRIDKRGYEHVLYIVGPETPDLKHLVEQGGWHTRPGQTADYDRFVGKLEAGQKWGFELVANPVKSKSRGQKKRGVVQPLAGVEGLTQWLLDRSEKHGFKVVQTPVGHALRVSEQNDRSFRRGAGRVSIRTVRYEGILEVINPDLLANVLKHGVGRSKAYGCGLMTLRNLTTAGQAQ